MTQWLRFYIILRKTCLRGMAVTVGMVVGHIGSGYSVDEILSDYPYLKHEDIMQALCYAAWRPAQNVRRSYVGRHMKLLFDMNLSPRWIDFLAEAEIQAVHRSTLGECNASDVEIMNSPRPKGN